MTIGAYTGKPGLALGHFSPGQNAIAVGVADVKVWAHEMIHAADHRNVGLKNGQHTDQEIVAELGACILLIILGYERGADRGGAFKYVSHYANESDPQAVAKACSKMLERTCNAVALILKTAQELQQPTDADTAAPVADVGELVAA